jgi:hypothetical protein
VLGLAPWAQGSLAGLKGGASQMSYPFRVSKSAMAPVAVFQDNLIFMRIPEAKGDRIDILAQAHPLAPLLFLCAMVYKGKIRRC